MKGLLIEHDATLFIGKRSLDGFKSHISHIQSYTAYEVQERLHYLNMISNENKF